MRHDLSISLWEFILGTILQYMVSAYFSCFLWSIGKGLICTVCDAIMFTLHMQQCDVHTCQGDP